MGVETEQVAARLQTRENRFGMTAVAKGAVDRDCTRPRAERGEYFRHHDGTMGASWGLAGGDDFRDRRGVTRRIVLLVFLRETTRILPPIPRTALMRGGVFGHGDMCSEKASECPPNERFYSSTGSKPANMSFASPRVLS